MPAAAVPNRIFHLTGAPRAVADVRVALRVDHQGVPFAGLGVEVDGSSQPLAVLQNGVLQMQEKSVLPVLVLIPGDMQSVVGGKSQRARVGDGAETRTHFL